MTRILVRGGRILDPAAEHDAVGDLLLVDGRVAAVGGKLRVEDAQVIDATGCWVAPGFIDLHSHLREPGQEYKETIGTGGRSAAAAASPPSRAWPTRIR
jgi:dihydroorotase